MRGGAREAGGRRREGVGRQRRKRHARGGLDERRLPLGARRLILLHLIHDALQPVCSAEDLRGQLLPVRRELLDAARQPLLRHREGLLLKVRVGARVRVGLRVGAEGWG